MSKLDLYPIGQRRLDTELMHESVSSGWPDAERTSGHIEAAEGDTPRQDGAGAPRACSATICASPTASQTAWAMWCPPR